MSTWFNGEYKSLVLSGNSPEKWGHLSFEFFTSCNLYHYSSLSPFFVLVFVTFFVSFVSVFGVASALGAWILFGPASAATWGGVGAVIGYSLGTAFPLFALIYLGKKFRDKYPTGKSLIEVIRSRFGTQLFKLILFLSIFYMTIFLIAEVTAVSILINYISGTDLWITASIVIVSSLVYTLYGGLRASIFTDNIQFIVFGLLLIIAFSYLISFNSNDFSW